MVPSLPARHVHLDFHTSEQIPSVGARFDKQQFQSALVLGKVNYITIFAKCHHSWSYYPTEVGMRHPTLDFDLMGQELEACRELKIRCAVYYTVGWSATDAERHPEWCCRNLDGSLQTFNYDVSAKPSDKKPHGSWKNLCPNTGYRDLMLAQTEEICRRYRFDGFFFDICFFPRCYCDSCRSQMSEAGIELDAGPASVVRATRFYTGVWRRFFEDCRQIVHAHHLEASIFFNGRADIDTPAELLELQTHYELEDLPTTWGGYDKFPVRSKFFFRRDHPPKPMMAMSGKFHTWWGEFGGFKHPDAIRYEAACMIAFGARCSFGDQLHPSGEIDLGTYANLSEAYRYVERIEEFGLDGEPCSNLGLFLDFSTGGVTGGQGGLGHEHGVASMLLEAQLDFDVVHPGAELSRFQAIILPGRRIASERAREQLVLYLRDGGSLLVIGESALAEGEKSFFLEVGAKPLGPARGDCDFIVPGEELGTGLKPPDSPVLCYESALRIAPAPGARTLAQIKEAFFDRTYGHYCSHQNTPNRLENASHVGGVELGRVVFLPHAWGRMYNLHGARIHRDLFLNALRRIHRSPVLEVRLPSAGRVNLVHQPARRRYVAHLLYAPPHARGNCQVIEDFPPLFEVPLALRVPQPIQRAWLPLSGQLLRVTENAGSIGVKVPRVECHEMVVFEY